MQIGGNMQMYNIILCRTHYTEYRDVVPNFAVNYNVTEIHMQ